MASVAHGSDEALPWRCDVTSLDDHRKGDPPIPNSLRWCFEELNLLKLPGKAKLGTIPQIVVVPAIDAVELQPEIHIFSELPTLNNPMTFNGMGSIIDGSMSHSNIEGDETNTSGGKLLTDFRFGVADRDMPLGYFPSIKY
jgi:hypothetical protein